MTITRAYDPDDARTTPPPANTQHLFTPEEAQKAYDEAPEVEIAEEEIDRTLEAAGVTSAPGPDREESLVHVCRYCGIRNCVGS